MCTHFVSKWSPCCFCMERAWARVTVIGCSLPIPIPLMIFWFSLIVTVGVGRKWKPCDSSDSDYDALMTPIPTPFSGFDFVLRRLWLRFRLRFRLDASENQALKMPKKTGFDHGKLKQRLSLCTSILVPSDHGDTIQRKAMPSADAFHSGIPVGSGDNK